MWRVGPLVIWLVAISLVALVFADPGTGDSTSVVAQMPARSTAVPARTTAPVPRRQGRQKNRRRTTTTTTTIDPEDEEDIDFTTPPTTTTIDPRTFDHSEYFTLCFIHAKKTV